MVWYNQAVQNQETNNIPDSGWLVIAATDHTIRWSDKKRHSKTESMI